MSGDMLGHMYQLFDMTDENARNTDRNREDNGNTQCKSSMEKERENKDVIDELLATIKEKDLKIESLRRINKIFSQRKKTESSHLESEKDLEIERLRKINCSLVQQRKDTERRSQQITREMARVTEASGTFGNINDELSNSRIIERFQKLYSNDWVNLSKWLLKTFPDVSELQIIKFLSKLMKYSYNECQIMADSQMRQFLMLDMDETIPANKQHPDLFHLRRSYAQRENSRKKIVQVILQRLLLSDTMDRLFFKGGKRTDSREKIKYFFNDYIDCCWLMVVANPAIKLKFDVLGVEYRTCMEQFSKYSLRIPVEDGTKIEGTICEVVWPSVFSHDDSSCYQKGDVVVVKKGKAQDHTNCDCCTHSVYQNEEDPTTQLQYGATSVTEGNAPISRKDKTVRKQRETMVSDV